MYETPSDCYLYPSNIIRQIPTEINTGNRCLMGKDRGIIYNNVRIEV